MVSAAMAMGTITTKNRGLSLGPSTLLTTKRENTIPTAIRAHIRIQGNRMHRAPTNAIKHNSFTTGDSENILSRIAWKVSGTFLEKGFHKRDYLGFCLTQQDIYHYFTKSQEILHKKNSLHLTS